MHENVCHGLSPLCAAVKWVSRAERTDATRRNERKENDGCKGGRKGRHELSEKIKEGCRNRG